MHKKLLAFLFVVGVAIAVVISLFVQQKNTYAWSSNDNIIDRNFWNMYRGGSDPVLINALRGDGNIGLDTSFYTQYWNSNTCDINNITVEYIVAGTDILPASLSGNTVYMLETGMHILTYDRVFAGNCTAIVGKSYDSSTNDAKIQLTGAVITGFIMSGKINNIIHGVAMIANNTIESNFDIINSHNITLTPIGQSSPKIGINIEGGSYVITVPRSAAGGNTIILKANNTQSLRVGYPVPNRSVSRNAGTGIDVRNSSGIVVFGDFDYATHKGIYMKNVSNVLIQGRWTVFSQGYGTFIDSGTNIDIRSTQFGANRIDGAVLSGINGLYLRQILANLNQRHGLYIHNSTNVSGSFINAHNNGSRQGNGIYISSSSGVVLSNVNAWSNIDDGIFVADNSSNVFIEGVRTYQNDNNGIQFMDTTNFMVTNYITSGNDESGVHIGSSFSGFLSSGLVYENQVGVSMAQGSTGNIVNDTVAYRNAIGFVIGGSDIDAEYNIVQNSIAYENSYAGFYMVSTTNNTFTNVHAYDNGDYGIVLHESSSNTVSQAVTNNNIVGVEMNATSMYNKLYDITSFSNIQKGLHLFKADYNNMQYLWLYDNSVGLHINEGKENIFNNMLSYDNENAGIAITGKGSNHNTINNFALFNNIYGLVMYDMGGGDEIRRNIFNNGALFNNIYAIYMQDSFVSNSTADNILNDLNIYNNDRGVYATGAGILSDNLYYGDLNIISNTVDFFGTNGADAILDAGTVAPSGLGWYPGGLNTFAGFVVTCNQAIQATNAIGANLLQYPYCNARGPQAWTGSVNVRYTFFPDIIKQQQPVAYTGVLPSMILIASGGYDANMYAGDFTWAGLLPFGGHIELDESMSYTYQSGGFTYRNTVGPLAIDMVSSQSPIAYMVTGVNDSTWNGISIQIGRNPWIISHTPFYFDLAPGGLSIIRVAYQSAGQESNYYGMIRGVEDDDISIDKQANILSATPGQQIGFTITVTNSGTAPAGFGQLIDFLPVGISPIGITASPAGVYSGSIHAYIWDIPVLSGGASYTFYITGTIISGYTGSVLINTGYYVSDYTSNGAGWSIYDEALVIFVVPGACGGSAQTGYGNVVLLTGGSAGLCEQGVVSLFTGPNQFNQYSWSCDGYNGGSNALCVAEYGWCGDGGLQSIYEQCDDGNNINGDGCSERCEAETPVCTITANPVYALGSPTTFTFTFPIWAQAYNLSFGNAIAVSGTGNLSGMSYTYTYPTLGAYTGTLSVRNAANTGRINTCTVQLSIVNAPIDGLCNSSITSQAYYTGTMPIGSLCISGDHTMPVLSGEVRVWTCNGQYGGSSNSCQANVSYCGDSIIGTGVGYNGQEQCDAGANNGVACIPGYSQSCSYCSNTCQNIILTGSFCGDGFIDANQGEECDLGSANGQLASGCSVSCQLDQLVCNIMATNTAGYPPLTTIFTAGPRSAGAYFDYGDGITGTNTVHTYTTPGSFIVTGYIPHPASGSIMLTCNYPVLVQDPVVPACDLPFVYSYTGGGSAYSGSQIPFALQITNTGSQYTGSYSIITYIYSGGQVISLGATGWSDVNRTYGSGIYTGIVLQQTGLGSGAVAYHTGYANTIHTGSYIAVTQVRQSKNNQEYLCSMHTYTGSVSIAPYCGDGIVNQPSEDCDGGTNCTAQCTIRRSSGGGGGISTDYCPNGDFSSSYYDGKCGEPVMHGAAPIGRACRYEDEQYLIRGTFTDSIRHRGRPYTEIMRLACMWRGRQTKIGLWNVEPDGWMQRDEALKTFVKILGVVFENFDIQSEDLLYTSTIPFADVSYDNWFSHYTNYAFTAGLTQGLTTIKDRKTYLDPTKNINRYEFAKLVVLAYEKIHGAIVVSRASTLQDVPMTHPYADYVRKLETIGLVEGYKQYDGSRVFRGDQLISRAEVAKLVSMGFNEQLIVTEQAVVASSAYQMIARAIQQTRTDRLTFIRNLFEQLKKIDDKVFLDKFQVSKDIFLKTLADKVLMPMLQ